MNNQGLVPKFKPGHIVKVGKWSGYHRIEEVRLKDDSYYEYLVSDYGYCEEDELDFFIHKDLKVTFVYQEPVLGISDDYYTGKELNGEIEWNCVEKETFSISDFDIPDYYFTDRDFHNSVLDTIERERKKWVLERMYKLFSEIYFK